MFYCYFIWFMQIIDLIDLQLMLQAKKKIEASDTTSNFSTKHQKLEQFTLKSTSKQKKKASQNHKPVAQTKDKVKKLFPSWTETKAITSEKNQGFYRRQPYIRQIQPSCYSSLKSVQLGQGDFIFLETHKSKFIYEDFEILNQYLLRQFLRFLKERKRQDESAQNIGIIFRQWIYSRSQEIPNPFVFCTAFKEENPQKFEQIVLLISQHCRYNFTKQTQFQTVAYFYKYKLFKERQLPSSQNKGRSSKISPQTIKNEEKKQRQLLQNQLEKYSDLYSQHLKEKEQLFENIKNTFLILKDIRYCKDQLITTNIENESLKSLHKKLACLLNKNPHKTTQAPCKQEEKKKSKSKSNKKQSNHIQKNTQKEAKKQ